MTYENLGQLPHAELKSWFRVDDDHPVFRVTLPLTYRYWCNLDRSYKESNYQIVLPKGYAVSRHIGSGGYSSVFAMSDGSGREYALKVPNPIKPIPWQGWCGECECDIVDFNIFDSEIVSRALLRGFSSENIYVPDIVLASRKNGYIVEELARGKPFNNEMRGNTAYERTARGLAQFMSACQSIPQDKKWMLGLLHWIGRDNLDSSGAEARMAGQSLVHDDFNLRNGNILYDEQSGRASLVDFSVAGYADDRNSRLRELEKLNNLRLRKIAREAFERA